MSTEYASLSKRIREAQDIDEVGLADAFAVSLYDLGLLTSSELSRLDLMAVDRLIALESDVVEFPS